MPMNPNFLCCIGAELKNSTQQTTRMTQVYLYRAFETQTIADMLSDGFFNEALGILRQDDLLLLYSPNETAAKWCYARVADTTRDGLEIEKIDINASDVIVDTTGFSNISGNNLQELMESIDAEFSKYVKKDGSSIMTGPLKFIAGSYSGAIAGGLGDGIEIYKINSSGTIQTEVASITLTNGFIPGSTNTISIGSNALKWKNLYLAGSAYISKINNGYDLLVPAKSGTLATKEEVDLAANSGRMITDQGVWYAKMYAATVAPSAEDGTNYADFSQTDGQGNPIIVTYNRVNGAWVQDQTITPPAEYDGYVPITSKIWDITEQAGQQGGRILWNHQSKDFTPYPQIISFESINITGNSTVIMPATPTDDSIPNKKYVDDAVDAVIPLPVGVILPFGGTTAPAGFLLCDGSAKSRTEYANLFAVIGTTYGAGDGSTTFNLPNGKIPLGTSAPVVRSGDTPADVPTFVSVDNISGTPDFLNAAAVGSVHGVAVLSRTTNIGNGLMFANTGLKTDLTQATAVSNAIIKY